MSYAVDDQKQIDNLTIRIHKTRSSMGADAATLVGQRINDLLSQQAFINVVFAAAPSQNEFLKFLSAKKGIDWRRVNAFHMDEYIGLSDNAPQTFGNFLKCNLFAKVPFRTVNYILANAGNVDRECKRYSDLLKRFPPDIVCMGIGENGHIAFNDPHVANFNDDVLVKVVDLDPACRRQQVSDGCFKDIEDVPSHAVTLTIPALLRANHIFCIVPGSNKASAVYHTLNSDVNEKYPSTILRTHSGAILFLDERSASKLKK